ncbi:MAG: hypothetical protein ABIM32_04010 [candidate division WOR-3 bacterium]
MRVKLLISSILIITLLYFSCKRKEGVPPEVRVLEIKSIPGGLVISFKVIDDDFEFARVLVNDSLYKTYTSSEVTDTISGLTPFTRYEITVEGVDASGLIGSKSVTKLFGPPPNIIYFQNFAWETELVYFTWDAVFNATGYRLQFSTSYDFTSLEFDTLVSSAIFSRTFSSGGGYYFRIRSEKDSILGEWSDPLMINIESLASPITLSPVNNDFCWISDTIMFSWAEKQGATSYRFQLSCDSSFLNTIVDTLLSGTSLTWPSQERLGRFYWRVSACRGEIWTNWSSVAIFDIVIPQPPTVTGPDSGSSFWNSEFIGFTWTAVNGAKDYLVDIAKDPGFSLMVLQGYPVLNNYLRWTPNYNLGTLYFRVRARRNRATTDFSNIISINSINSKPSLLYPADGTSFWNAETVLLKWSRVQLATSYKVLSSSSLDLNYPYFLEVIVSDTFYRWVPKYNTGRVYWGCYALKGNVSGYKSDSRSLILYPYELGSYTPYDIASFDISGNYVFIVRNLATGIGTQGELCIINVSSPYSPIFVTRRADPLVWPTRYNDICVRGNYAYIADSIWGLRILNVSNFSNIYQEGYWEKYPNFTYRVFAEGNQVYLITGSGTSRYLEILDVSVPSNPRLLQSIGLSRAVDLFVSSGYAFVAREALGVTIVRISDGRIVGNVSGISGNAVGVFVSGSFLYVAAENGGIYVVDISNISSPRVLGSFTGINAVSLAARNNIVYATGYPVLLEVVKATTPSSPYEVGRLQFGSYYGKEVKISGNHAYVSDGNSIRIIAVKE